MTTNLDGTNMNNARARENCEADRSTLASIRDQAENDFVKNLTRTGNPSTYEPYNDTPGEWRPNLPDSHVHIGAVYVVGNREWEWFDRTPFNYSNWVNNTAIYLSGGGGTYATILPDFAPFPGGWDDINAFTEVRAGVCAYDLR